MLLCIDTAVCKRGFQHPPTVLPWKTFMSFVPGVQEGKYHLSLCMVVVLEEVTLY
jgi:hypothetical protein